MSTTPKGGLAFPTKPRFLTLCHFKRDRYSCSKESNHHIGLPHSTSDWHEEESRLLVRWNFKQKPKSQNRKQIANAMWSAPPYPGAWNLLGRCDLLCRIVEPDLRVPISIFSPLKVCFFQAMFIRYIHMAGSAQYRRDISTR
jgi:hypothetical protein